MDLNTDVNEYSMPAGLASPWRDALALSVLELTRTRRMAVFWLAYLAMVIFFLVGALVQRTPLWWMAGILGAVGVMTIIGHGATLVLSGQESDCGLSNMVTGSRWERETLVLHSGGSNVAISYTDVEGVMSGFGLVMLLRSDGTRSYISTRLAPPRELARFRTIFLLSEGNLSS